MKEIFIERNFRPDRMILIKAADRILNQYAELGIAVTLRTLYYRFVTRNLVANTEEDYTRVGALINHARLAGLIDWEHIVDRTRAVRSASHWDNPRGIIKSAARSYRVDSWEGQLYKPEVWIEKDAQAGVIEGVCDRLDVPWFSCRGYVSQSEMWSAGQRFREYHEGAGQQPIIFYLGDHDPSGLDMTRDIRERLSMFAGFEVLVVRLALNMEQVIELDPPPNPAKLKDSRAGAYVREFGYDSWELDALEPDYIVDLVEEAVTGKVDGGAAKKALERQAEGRDLLNRVWSQWPIVTGFVNERK